MNKKFNAEQITKALAKIARSESAELAVSSLEDAGDYDGALVIKSMQTTGDVTGAGVGVFDSFLPLIRRRSLIGMIDSVRPFYKVPENVRVLFGDNPDAGFVAEGAEIPFLQSDLATVVMTPKRISAIQVITQELVRSHAEHLLSKAIITSTAKIESQTFISATAASQEQPAGVLNGLTPLTGSAVLADDVAALVAAFDGDLSQAVLVVSDKTAVKLSAIFPNAGIGGDIGGVAIVANHSVPNDLMAIIEPQRILLSDAGVSVEISKDATLVMRDEDGVTVTGDLNLFQQNLQACRVNRYIDWKPAAGAAVVITGGTY
ncbi:MAG: phage major capsid protein [Pseudomonas sp.]|nr:phage major capsid protein [Pseudomonas sp.]